MKQKLISELQETINRIRDENKANGSIKEMRIA